MAGHLSEKKTLLIAIPLLLALLLAAALFSASVGSAHLSFATVWKIAISRIPLAHDWVTHDWDPSSEVIVWQLRIPRILLGMLVGASLSAAGVAFQGVLRNPLADPYILGVSSGSSLGAAIVILMGWQLTMLGQWALPLAAFSTGLLALLAVFALARSGNGLRMETLLLAGVVVQAFIGALLAFILAISDWKMQMIMLWMMGSLTTSEWSFVWLVLPYFAIGALIIAFYARQLNVLAMGEETAHHLGIAVHRTRIVLLVTASLITAAAVSVSGTIGFVGLVIPHIVRLATGPNHRVVLPISVIAGALFLVGADTLARTVMEPRELPIGIFTALLGAPFFGYLLRQARSQYFS